MNLRIRIPKALNLASLLTIYDYYFGFVQMSPDSHGFLVHISDSMEADSRLEAPPLGR